MRTLIFLALFTASLSALAELRVIHDAGNTRPLLPLARASGLFDDSNKPNSSRAADKPVRPSDPYAVVSPSLTPGVQPRLATHNAARHLPRPIFLLGADRFSLRWLQQHHARLKALGAVGLVVAASGKAEFARLRQAANGLPLAAGSGEILAEQFGLKHYPVLIGPAWIEQ